MRFNKILLFLVPLTLAVGQNSQNPGVPVTMIVTAEASKGAPVPELSAQDVMVYENKERLPVTGLTAVRKNPSGLELWVLIDDGHDTSFGTQLSDLKDFISREPASTRIGVGYIRNGTIAVTQDLSADHAAAAKSIRLPMGPAGIAASPYIALESLLKKWPAGNPAREVLMITSGIDPDYGSGPQNPYLLNAIEAAQKPGVVVHSIYYGGAGHFGHSYWGIFWGQNYLSQLAEETGGEFFWQGDVNPVSISPYLKDLGRRFDSQYLLTFAAKGGQKAELKPIKLGTEVPHLTLHSASMVYVPACQSCQ